MPLIWAIALKSGDQRSVPSCPVILQTLGTDVRAHAGVDVLGGRVVSLPVAVAVVLNEDVIPDLHHARVFAVDR